MIQPRAKAVLRVATAAVSVLGAGLLFSAAAFAAPEDAHIHAVETGLLPAILVKGEPAPAMTLADRMRDLHVPGVSIAYFKNGHLVWARGYGYADVAHQVPVTPDTLFQAGSISKPLSAMAALKLVQEGRLNLDEDVNARLKAWKVPDSPFTAQEKVTLRRLLSHTAGLTVHGFEGYERSAPLPTLMQVLNGAKPANSAPVVVNLTPGTKWVYSGGGYVVAELLMQETTGEPFAQFMRETVLQPSGMDASTYEQPLPVARQGVASLAYDNKGVMTPGGWNVYPEQTAAGLWTTPSDLARWSIELQNEADGKSSRILTPATAHAMLTPGLGEWGLGLNIPKDGPPRFGHGGANVGFRNDFLAFIGGDREGFAIMTNSDNGGELISELERALAATYGWPIDRPQEMAAVVVPAATLAPYAGVYEEPQIGKLIITVKDGRLYLTIPALQADPMETRTASPTSFFAPLSGIVGEFQRAADGSVAGLVLKTPYGPFTAKKTS
ncbi:MAG TPA: serine hydrolase [Caulobacteraceae bacterium]|jgi:CubicO group peptidase (beta-lactamase class C family)